MAEYRRIEGAPYSVSQDGRVRNDRTGYVLTPVVDKTGYCRVGLWENGSDKLHLVHRLVAKAFVPNPSGKPEVNHIDGDKQNNNASNLEWVTGAENKKHCREVLGKVNRTPNVEAAHNACKKKVRCVETGIEYESITAAARAIGIAQSGVSLHLLGRRDNCKGFHFKLSEAAH